MSRGFVRLIGCVSPMRRRWMIAFAIDAQDPARLPQGEPYGCNDGRFARLWADEAEAARAALQTACRKLTKPVGQTIPVALEFVPQS